MSLEADGLLSVYEIETGRVVAEYEGLAIHHLVMACTELHEHPSLQTKIPNFPEGHVIVDTEAWSKILGALSDLDHRLSIKMMMPHMGGIKK